MSTSAITECPASPAVPAIRGTFANLASVMGGEGLLRVANLIAGVLIARQYGASTFGLYATSLAYATIAIMLADNGLQMTAVTTISESPSEVNAVASRLYIAKSIPLAPGLAAATVLLGIFRASSLTWIVAGFITLRCAIQAYCQLQIAILKATNRMQSIGVVQALHFGVLMAGLIMVYRYNLSIQVLMEILLGGQLFELVASFVRLRMAGIHIKRTSFSEAIRVLRYSTPFGVSFTLASFFLRMDLMVLVWIAPVGVVGHFAAAQQVLVVVYVVSWLFGSVLLPELVRLSSLRAALDAYIARWTKFLSLTSVPVAVIGAIGGKFAMRTVYGEAFAAAGTTFSVLFLAIPFILLNALYLNRAIAVGAKSLYLTTYCVTAAAGLALDLVLTVTLGIIGTALAALLREVGMFILLQFWGVRSGSASPLEASSVSSL